MKTLFWLVLCVALAAIVLIIRHVMKKSADRQKAEEARAAAFLAQMAGAKHAPAAASEVPPAAPHSTTKTAANTLELQKLLFDAARKAGDAGEPALAIQLYGRLIARFPDTNFAAPARLAVEEQKKKIIKA